MSVFLFVGCSTENRVKAESRKQKADALDSAEIGLLHQILELCDLMIVYGCESAGALRVLPVSFENMRK